MKQLQWFVYRDVFGFVRGPAAAFVTYCRTRAPEPENVARGHDVAEERCRQEHERARQKAALKAQDEAYLRRLAEMTDGEIELLKNEARKSLGPLHRGDDSPAFVGTLKKLVIEHKDTVVSTEMGGVA